MLQHYSHPTNGMQQSTNPRIAPRQSDMHGCAITCSNPILSRAQFVWGPDTSRHVCGSVGNGGADLNAGMLSGGMGMIQDIDCVAIDA